VQLRFARPVPTATPGLAADLTTPGPRGESKRKDHVAARLRPVMTSLADHFGLQKSCLDATFTAGPGQSFLVI